MLKLRKNVQSLNAQNYQSTSQTRLNKGLECLSSICRINKESNKASGLSIFENIPDKINNLNQALNDTQDSIEFLRSTKDIILEINNILKRMKEISILYINKSTTSIDRKYLSTEFDNLKSDISKITSKTELNDLLRLNNIDDTRYSFKIGYEKNLNSFLTATLTNVIENTDLSLTDNKITSKISVQSSIEALDKTITSATSLCFTINAIERQLNYTVINLSTCIENMKSANSNICDVDAIKKSSNLTWNQLQISKLKISFADTKWQVNLQMC